MFQKSTEAKTWKIWKPFEFPVWINDKNLNKLLIGEDINKLKNFDAREIILVKRKVKLRPTKSFQLFWNINREPTPIPYYLQRAKATG